MKSEHASSRSGTVKGEKSKVKSKNPLVAATGDLAVGTDLSPFTSHSPLNPDSWLLFPDAIESYNGRGHNKKAAGER